MRVKLFVPMAGTIQVEVDDESVLLSLQDLVARPVVLDFPIPVVVIVDKPPLTGLITQDSNTVDLASNLKDK